MSVETVRADLAIRAPDLHVIVTESSTATVELVSRLDAGGGTAAIERVFARSPREVEPDWRDYLRSL